MLMLKTYSNHSVISSTSFIINVNSVDDAENFGKLFWQCTVPKNNYWFAYSYSDYKIDADKNRNRNVI